jgi:hypothetical protein
MQLNANDTALVRTHPQQTNLSLSIFQPRTVLQCQINDASISKGARTINYDTVSLGNFSAVEAGMTLLVGSTAGARDIGKIRIRSATASSFLVAENSDINWANRLFLTVLRYWEIWPIYPRIIPDPNKDTDVIFYKDYDIPYSNQNSIGGTFVNMLSHRAAYLQTGSVALWYCSSGTYNLLGNVLNYNWSFEGGTPSGSSLANPGYVSYSAPGHYVTRLIVSGTSGEIDTSYRYVSIYNTPDVSSVGNTPLKWQINNLSGSRGEAGYRAQITVWENITINEGDVVVLFSNDWYGSANKSIGGNDENNSSIFFVGHIRDGTIKYDYKQSSVTFEIASITDVMKSSEGYAISLESSAAPSKWFQMLDLDGRRGLYHYLKWHTTVMSIADFSFAGQDLKGQYFDSDRTSMYEALYNFMHGALMGTVISDRQGHIWADVDAQAYSNPSGSFPIQFSLTTQDWMGEPSIEERNKIQTSFIEMGGVAYSGVYTGTFSALLSNAPGNAPSVRGTAKTIEGLYLAGQSQLNTMAGNVLANENSRYPSISFDLTSNFRNFEIAPQNVIGVDINPSDTVRRINLHAPYIIDEMSWEYNPETEINYPKIVVKSVLNGNPGDTITIPPIPDGGGYSGFGGNFKFGNISPGAIPIYASTVGNRPSGRWGGYFQNDPTFAMPLVYTGTIYSYGIASNPANSNPIVPILGLYLLVLNIDYNLIAGTAQGTFSSTVGIYPSFLKWKVPILVTDTKTYGYTGVQVLSAGQQVNFFIGNDVANSISGNFTLSLTLLTT